MPSKFVQYPHVVAVCTSNGGIPKHCRPWVNVRQPGLEGDGHNHAKHCTPLQAVSLQDIECLEELNREGYSLVPGVTGENLTVRNLHVNTLPLGTLLLFANGVILELTKVRKPCYVLDTIDLRLKEDILDRCGMYARVLGEGTITPKEQITVCLPHYRPANNLICNAVLSAGSFLSSTT